MNDLSKLIQTLIKSILIAILIAVSAGYIYRPDSYYYRHKSEKFTIPIQETHKHRFKLFYTPDGECYNDFPVFIENPFNKEIATVLFIISTSVLTLYLNKRQNNSN